MKLLRDTKIKTKIIIIIFIIGAFSTIIGNLVNYLYEVQKSKERLINNTLLQARLMSEYFSTPLEFGYKKEAQEAINKLNLIPDIQDGMLFYNDTLFASYHKKNSDSLIIPKELNNINYYIDDFHLHVKQEIVYKNKYYGYFYIRCLIDWQAIVYQRAAVSTIIVAIMLLFILILAYIMQRYVSEPIVNLTNKMNIVAKEKDYSIHFQNHSKDEIGELYFGFNTMLREINNRENEIKSAFNSLKASEERFRKIIERTPFPLCYLKKDGTISFRNERFIQVFGYTSTDIPTISEWWTNAYPNENYRKWVIENWQKALDKAQQIGIDIEKNDYNVVCKNGEERIVEISGIIVYDGYLVTFIDLTEHKRVEIQLKEKNDRIETQNEEYMQLNEELMQTNEELFIAKTKAEESDKLKSAFLANMSHEIRTPMNGILGFSELLTTPNLELEKQKEYCEIIENCSNQLLSIIDDLLDISKIEANQLKIELLPTKLNSILPELYSIMLPKAKNHGINLLLVNDLEDDITIITDKLRLRQILLNLLTNAIKFTKHGHVRFGYSIKNQEIEFFVEDTGIGIPDDQFEFIFERFRQVETEMSRTYGGTGLGLSISNALVHLLGGKIWLTSEINKGTTFFFTIPYKIVNTHIQDNTQTNHDFNIKKRITILVAEDEDTNFRYISELLSNMDINIIHTKNGLETIEIAIQNPEIKLILMDIKMPVLDGYKATVEIKKVRKNLPIIAQTAYAQASDKERALELGCDDYLSKPIKRKLLMEILNKYINN